MEEDRLRDFIYLDLPRLASLYSQLTGGLVTETELSTDSESEERNIRKYDLKVFKPEFGGKDVSSQQYVETRVMHHEIFNSVEKLLFENGYAIDINESLCPSDIQDGEARERFKNTFYIRATGWTMIEHYEAMKNVAERYNEIIEFVRKSQNYGIQESEEYTELQKKIAQKKEAVQSIKDRNKKAVQEARLDTLEKDLDKLLNSGTELENVEEWIVDGFKTWVDTFMSNAIYFHLYPFDDLENFHVKANLKSERFMDGEITAVDYAYSGRPTVKLSLLGLITSVPPEEEPPFDPMTEFEGHEPEDEEDDPVGFESAIRGMFSAFEELERFAKFERYPNITVYPLAVFRDIRPNEGVIND
ncbi:MAG: hypothetical protein KGZ25_13795 [Planctomycetes bacterium]|nr:hypothetical protein [Planctomycetota bacterium]